jgi:hypothetical protein
MKLRAWLLMLTAAALPSIADAEVLYSPALMIGPGASIGCFLTNVRQEPLPADSVSVKVLRSGISGSAVVRSVRALVDVGFGGTVSARSAAAESADTFFCKFNIRGSTSVRAVACALEPDGHCTAAVAAQ